MFGTNKIIIFMAFYIDKYAMSYFNSHIWKFRYSKSLKEDYVMKYVKVNIAIVFLLTLSLLLSATGIPVIAIELVVKIEDIPPISQRPNLPTGCEATSLTMLLNFFGKNLTKEQVADMIPKGPKPYTVNGLTYGADPKKVFVGSPYDSNSYGVFHQPILSIVNSCFPTRAENLTGKTMEDLFEVIDSGRPVMVWATINMLPMRLTTKWKLNDGSAFQWPGEEHTLLLIGYTNNYVIVNDPYTGQEEYYSKALFETRWKSLGLQAVTVKPTAPKRTASNYYNDVYIDDWFCDTIETMTEVEIISGYSDMAFRPSENISKAEFIKMIVTVETDSPLVANQEGEWYVPYIIYAIQKGLIIDTDWADVLSETDFERPILRQDVSLIIHRIYGQVEPDAKILSEIKEIYTDVTELDEVELKAIAFVREKEIIIGSEGKLSPEKEITRAEATVVIARVLNSRKSL
ncbi:MAG: hypothetical protein CVU84_07810 [Firmicutes bacterium HGW-Firmicutes-1]|nr:MAG: hypothetical protein CVU84_07810 [Firmicutes bacterium HGW-Firmicutes-1]